MTEYLGIVPFIAVAWLLAIWLYPRIGLVHLILIYWSFQAVAVYSHYLIHGRFLALLIFLGSVYAWLLGLAVVRGLSRPSLAESCGAARMAARPVAEYRFLRTFFLLLAAVVAYHYAAGGIPLMAAEIKKEAFELGRSGLFGIPGRIARYGPLVLIFVIAAQWQLTVNASRESKSLFLKGLMFAGVVFVLNGHKGALLVVVQTLIITSPYFGDLRPAGRLSWAKLAVVGSVAFIAVMALAAVLIKSRTDSTGILATVIDRIFVISGRPFDFVVNQFVPAHGVGNGSYFLHDLRYVLGQVGLTGSPPDFTSTQMVSAEIHGRDVAEDYVVPTTLTVFGQFYMNFGLAGTLVGAILYGMLTGWIYGETFRFVDPVSRSILFLFQLEVFSVATKGNAIFSVSSMFFGLAFTLVLLLFARWCHGGMYVLGFRNPAV